MSKGYPVISVLIAAAFTLSIMLSGCKPDYQNPTETKHTLSSMDPSRETGDSQMPEPSESVQETQNFSEPTEESTEPIASQPTVTPTQGGTQPTQPSTVPRQESTTPTQESTAPTQSSNQATQASTAATEPTTQPTQEIVPPTTQATVPPSTEETESDDGLLTLDEYRALSGAQQLAYKRSFESEEAFNAWMEQAIAEKDANKNQVNIGQDGSVDLDDIVNGNS